MLSYAQQLIYHHQCRTKASCFLQQSFTLNGKDFSFSAYYTGWPRRIQLTLNSFSQCVLEQTEQALIMDFSKANGLYKTWHGETINFTDIEFDLFTMVDQYKNYIQFKLSPRNKPFKTLVTFYMYL
ncbi:MAG TPA: hypothetical protein PKC21_09885 [Oligoflexia bacterium]|nr:hypothetical protein [Oligoflexia bacterium]HMR25649.1 hypothetical protein [Oligoflexia bacterium]